MSFFYFIFFSLLAPLGCLQRPLELWPGARTMAGVCSYECFIGREIVGLLFSFLKAHFCLPAHPAAL